MRGKHFCAIGLWLVGALCLSSCTHVRAPVNRFDVPETGGHENFHISRVDLVGVQGGPAIELIPNYATVPPAVETPSMTTSMLNYFFQTVFSLSRSVELGLRYQVNAPLLFRGMFQISGDPRSIAIPWNFPIALVVSAGATLGSDTDIESDSDTTFNQYSVRALAFDAGLSLGLRISRVIVVYAVPFISITSISGSVTQTSSGVAQAYSASAGVSSKGAAFGLQIQAEDVSLRLEGAYTNSTLTGAAITTMYGGMALGLMF